jgi:hypothetical protein
MTTLEAIISTLTPASQSHNTTPEIEPEHKLTIKKIGCTIVKIEQLELTNREM